MVRDLHAAGIEVILDVVYNHSAEGNHLGPTLSFKGFDNPMYYRLVEDDPRFYFDYTGTGNTLNMRSPHTLQLVMDSLRWWATEMHVDGFRFDLASTLARSLHEVDRLSAFFDIVQQDPVISQVKLIAEPWDVGEGGYQVGNFPPQWAEWNGRYRDDVRDFWRGAAGRRGRARPAAHRLVRPLRVRRPPPARVDQLRHRPRRLHAGRPHRLRRAAQRGQRRGRQRRRVHNRSWNCGVEGPTDDPRSSSCGPASAATCSPPSCCRRACRCSSAATSSGRTQGGNNNAYCQDNEVSWFDWDAVDETLLGFTRDLVAYRRQHPVFRRRRFFQGRPIRMPGRRSRPPRHRLVRRDGAEMTDEQWEAADDHVPHRVPQRRPRRDRPAGRARRRRPLLLVLNGDHERRPGRRSRPPRSGRPGASTSTPRPAHRTRRGAGAPPAPRRRRRPQRARAPSATRPPMPERDRHLPVAADAGRGFAAAAAAVPDLAASASATSTCRPSPRRCPGRPTATT